MDKNFDGLYSLKEIYLDDNRIKSLVSAAFRHVSQLEILSLRNNEISGEYFTIVSFSNLAKLFAEFTKYWKLVVNFAKKT